MRQKRQILQLIERKYFLLLIFSMLPNEQLNKKIFLKELVFSTIHLYMVYFLFTLSFFFFGACLGSFCGTLMETTIKRSFWTGRSQCLTCSHKLRWFELIPVISYLMQAGRCRKCGIRIPSWILSVEMMMGIMWMFFGTLFVTHGYSPWIIGSHLLFLSMLLMLAIEDIRSFTIPDRLSLPMIVVTLVLIALSYKFEML